MALNTTRPNIPHTCSTTGCESQITIHLAVFELHAILGHLRRMTPKWHWTLQSQTYPCLFQRTHVCPKFKSVSLNDQQFWVTWHFEICAPNDPKMIWALWGQMYAYICCISTHEPSNYNPFRSMETRFWVTCPFFHKCAEWPQNDIEHHSVKGTCTLYLGCELEIYLGCGFSWRNTLLLDNGVSFPQADRLHLALLQPIRYHQRIMLHL